jgi:hypothetical protein
LSRRALGLHAATLFWVPGCLVAGWWQVTRALGGNPLSYLYSVEWPVFALVGLWGWWSLIHTDPETVGARAQRRIIAEQAARAAARPSVGEPALQATGRRTEDEDAELAAYNDRLASLAASGETKTWRRR